MTDEQAFHVLDETHILLFLVQFLLLLGCAKLLGLLFERLKQPTVTADILVGIVFGPTILGRFAPAVQRALFPGDPFQISMLDTVAWIGILFLLLVTGLEVNFASVWKHKGKALWISFSDIIIPIIISAGVLAFLPSRYMIEPQRRLLFVLFISTIMTISAMPVSIRVMQDLKLLRTDLGFLTISALSINDVIGWVIFTIILGAFAHGRPDFLFVSGIIFFTALFILLAATVVNRVVAGALGFIERRATDAVGYSLTAISLVGFMFGAIAQRIGIHALFGFFLAGLIAGEAGGLTEKTRSIISQMVYAVFVPIFFANIGLKIDIAANFDLFLVLLFTALGIGARFIGAYIGVVLAGAPGVQRWPVAALHTPGGEMHIVIGTLALELQLINQTVFVAIIIAAVLSSITLGPWLSLIIKRITPAGTIRIPAVATLDIAAGEKYDALAQLCRRASVQGNIVYEHVFRAARNREEGMSTGLGGAIAIPHARLPQIPRPLIIFGRSGHGIDWNSPDGIPAKLIFLIITDEQEPQIQLRIYSQLLRIVEREEEKRALIEASDSSKAVEILNDYLRVDSLNP
ncbi:MAG: hypothetical protein GF344_02095 [Chitinivibrionales bacterium]|nr:hypothetical protein [Chitinivibrionales bacterium]MBD3355885.1 hypothetical protein [Chitinivibrionales bacterium]